MREYNEIIINKTTVNCTQLSFGNYTCNNVTTFEYSLVTIFDLLNCSNRPIDLSINCSINQIYNQSDFTLNPLLFLEDKRLLNYPSNVIVGLS